MMHRFLLCIALFSMVASAQPDSRSSAGANAESWSFGFGSEEGGGHSSYMGMDIADVTTERCPSSSSRKSMARKSPWWMRTLPPAKPDCASTTN